MRCFGPCVLHIHPLKYVSSGVAHMFADWESFALRWKFGLQHELPFGISVVNQIMADNIRSSRLLSHLTFRLYLSRFSFARG